MEQSPTVTSPNASSNRYLSIPRSRPQGTRIDQNGSLNTLQQLHIYVFEAMLPLEKGDNLPQQVLLACHLPHHVIVAAVSTIVLIA